MREWQNSGRPFFGSFTDLYHQIFFHNYRLSRRSGALLKVIFRDGLTGYGDCHPWPELGDLPLKEQLNCLVDNRTTKLTKQSLKFARIDAEGRGEKKNLLRSLNVPKSHYLLMSLGKNSQKELEQALSEGFEHFKVKLGANLVKELKILSPMLETPRTRWRLDFNNQLKQLTLLKSLENDTIEFVEDPFPYDKRWYEFPFAIAFDRQENPPENAYQYKIVKPAIEAMMESCKPLIVTSYLGHPLGQAADAYAAANLAKQCDVRVCGLLSHRVYPRNLFSERLSWQGPDWKHPEGTGFGFDDLLEGIKWHKL